MENKAENQNVKFLKISPKLHKFILRQAKLNRTKVRTITEDVMQLGIDEYKSQLLKANPLPQHTKHKKEANNAK